MKKILIITPWPTVQPFNESLIDFPYSILQTQKRL